MNRHLEALANVLAEIEADREALNARERELARQAEEMTLHQRVRQAEAMGRQLERERVVMLIDAQLAELGRAGLNAVALRALRDQVRGLGP